MTATATVPPDRPTRPDRPERPALPPPARPHRLRDLRLLTGRALRREVRQIDALLVGVLLPVLIMAAMVGVFGGAIDTGAVGLSYADYVTPAVMLMCAGYGAAMTGASITDDLIRGMTDRLRTLPIAGWALPAGYVLAALVRNLVTTALAVLAALVLGFRPAASPAGWLLVAALVTGFILAIAWLSMVWGLLVQSVQAAGAFSFVLLFIPYLSSAFVPVETLPGALQGLAAHQPMTPLVDTARALLLGAPVADVADTAWTAGAWVFGVVALAVPLAALLFRRRIRGR